MWLKFYLMLNFSENYTCVATVMMLLRTATIDKYWYNNKIHKTVTTNK